MGRYEFEYGVQPEPADYRVKILDGSFGENVYAKLQDGLLVTEGRDPKQIVSVDDIESLEILSEYDGGAGHTGWALGGCLVAGPLGLLMGMILGQRKRVKFIASISGGRHMVADTYRSTYDEMVEAIHPLLNDSDSGVEQ